MTFTFKPAIREQTPLIIGIAGPTKSGKTYSAHRLAIGLANGGTVAMINAEGPRGHQYAERFKYVATEIRPPYRPERYVEAITAAAALKPAVLIIDSMSHMHDGPGGMLEYHKEELDRMAGDDWKKRDKCNFTAWIKPKAAENACIYSFLGLDCPVILCFRAKEKLKIVKGREPIDLGWQPISGERVGFETLFTLMLPPHSKGVPDLDISEMREPFDSMVPKGLPIDENLGRALREWSSGTNGKPAVAPTTGPMTYDGPLVQSEAESNGVTAFHGADGLVFRTQDDAIADRAQLHVGTGEIVRVTYSKTRRGGLQLLDVEDAAQPNPADERKEGIAQAVQNYVERHS